MFKVLSLLAFLLAASPALADMPAVGTKAPAFALKDQNGKAVTLDSLKDKGLWYVIYFYPKDFTEGCSIEAHNFQRDLAKYKEKKPPSSVSASTAPTATKNSATNRNWNSRCYRMKTEKSVQPMARHSRKTESYCPPATPSSSTNSAWCKKLIPASAPPRIAKKC